MSCCERYVSRTTNILDGAAHLLFHINFLSIVHQNLFSTLNLAFRELLLKLLCLRSARIPICEVEIEKQVEVVQ